MPHYYFKEIWTPLKWFRIHFFRDDEGQIWIKKGSQPRKPWRVKKVDTPHH